MYKDKEQSRQWFKKNFPLRYKKRMDIAFSLKGNKCRCCGSDHDILFHHLRDKKYNVTSMTRNSMKSFLEEVGKCIILCRNCHEMFHRVKTGEYTQLKTLTGL